MPSPVPSAAWPDADRTAWDHALLDDPLAPGGGGGGAKWRPRTRQFHQAQYGGWLAWLNSIGEDLGVTEPAARATRERVRAYLTALEIAGVADHTRAGRLQGLHDALRVMAPGADIRFIGRAAGRISAQARRARDIRPRLRPPGDVLAVGEQLMSRSEDETLPAWLRAVYFRDGLLISLLAYRPLRIANLSGIDLGRQLVQTRGGYRLEFAAEETKANRPFTCTWPRALNDALSTYLEHHRPVLLAKADGAPDDALWLSRKGRGMPSASAGQIIRLRSAEYGLPIFPHLMRYIAATTTAEDRPEQVADVAAMLGHASLEVSERHYILAGGMRAAERYQSVLADRAKGSGAVD